jgi:DNA-binding NarL/FixJ family response regulator
MIRVAIVDDHAVVRQGLAQLLGSEDDIEIVGTAANGDEAHALLASVSPDVYLMDLSMPEVDGVEATRRIVADAPGVNVVVLTSRTATPRRSRTRSGRPQPATLRSTRRPRGCSSTLAASNSPQSRQPTG